MHTDGSLSGYGGALFHKIDGKLKPFYFLSYLLKGAEKNYSAAEIEVLAVVRITEKCKQYLYGKHFIIVTDCSAIKWLHSKQSSNARIQRWALHLQSFNYTVKHRAGIKNVLPDYLSRYPTEEGADYL